MLVVRPQNSDEQVDELFRVFDEHNLALHADTRIRITEVDSGKLKFYQREISFRHEKYIFLFS